MFSNTTCDATKELGDLKKFIPNDTILVLDKFHDGYLTGYNWPDVWNYRPGGPFLHSCRISHYYNERHTCKSCIMTKQSLAEHVAWMKGWDLGHAKKLKEGRKNSLPTREEIQAFNEGKRRSNLYA